MFGAGLGLAGQAVEMAATLQYLFWGCLALIAVLYAYREFRGRECPLPQRHWQVPRDWAWRGRLVFSFEFGFVLGLGFLTFIPFAGYYFLVAACFSTTDYRQAALIMGIYGLARAVPVVSVPLTSMLIKRPHTLRVTNQAAGWWAQLTIRTRALRAVSLVLLPATALVSELSR